MMDDPLSVQGFMPLVMPSHIILVGQKMVFCTPHLLQSCRPGQLQKHLALMPGMWTAAAHVHDCQQYQQDATLC